MIKTSLGKTGLEISRIIFGGFMTAGEAQKDADYYVSYAYDRGVNYYDVAPNYDDAEVKLGEALRPYRDKVYLACKTFERSAEASRKDLENSLRKLHTGYFDVYQLHCLLDEKDVDRAFAEDGSMKTVIDAKKKGYIRYVGITAHDEAAALRALSLYDFDTVMFPLNWAIGLDKGIGIELSKVCKEGQKGLIAMKALAHRIWSDDEDKIYPKSWTKPIMHDDRLLLCAMKYALSLGADAIVPPGIFEHFAFAVDHIAECIENPLHQDDIDYLKMNTADIGDRYIF